MLKNVKDSTYFHLLVIAISSVAAIYLLQIFFRLFVVFNDVIIILVLAWLISFIFEPLIELLQKGRFSRIGAALVVYLLVSLIMVWLFVQAIPILITQINALLTILPSNLDQIPPWANRLADFFLSALNNSVLLIQKLASLLFYFVFVLVLSFYLVVDKEKMWSALMRLIPKNYQDKAEFLKSAIDKSFAGFLRVQIIFGLLFGATALVFLLFFTPNFALLAGILAGLLNILPLVGPFLALIPAFVVLLPLGLTEALWLSLILFVLQQIELNILGPKIIGKTMRLHPVWVLIAFLLGFKIAGIWGAIFAVPVASIVGIMASALLPGFLNHTE
ncbi:AI-2E family transporter [Candidatus Gottesmanbacteria bacterium]|nr:AI-2E family transporter [Candidatus Gottesmanbacteria bacterium]